MNSRRASAGWRSTSTFPRSGRIEPPGPPPRPPPPRPTRARLADRRAVPDRLRARSGGNRAGEARGRWGGAGGGGFAAVGIFSPRQETARRWRRSAAADAARLRVVRGSHEPAIQSARPASREGLHGLYVARGPSLRPDLRARP